VQATTGGAISVSNTLAGDLTLQADLNHGSYSKTFAARVGDTRYSSVSSGHVLGGGSSAGVPHIYILDGFRVGDIITSITFSYKGGAATDDLTSIEVFQFDQAGAETDAGASPASLSNIGTSWATQVVSFTQIGISAGETVVLRVVPTQAGISFGNCTVAYNHP
jgi:hypothetical protein